MLLGTAEADQVVPLVVLLVGSLLAVAYLLPIPVRAFLRPPADDLRHGEAPLAMTAPLTLTAFGCVALFFAAQRLIEPWPESWSCHDGRTTAAGWMNPAT